MLPPLTTKLRRLGGAFLRVSVAVDETGGLTPSSAVSVSRNVPSSVHTTLVASEWVSLNVQAAPASTSGPALWAQVTPNAAPSGSIAVPTMLIEDPSLPAYGPPAEAVGGAFPDRVHSAITGFEVCVTPRWSMNEARSVSRPAAVPVYENVTVPSDPVIAVPVVPAWGPLPTVKVTVLFGCGTPPDETRALTAWVAPTGRLEPAGASEMSPAASPRLGQGCTAFRRSRRGPCTDFRSRGRWPAP